MVIIKYKEEEYVCDDEKRLREELLKETTPGLEIKKADPELIMFVLDKTRWAITGHVFGKISDRVPNLIRKK